MRKKFIILLIIVELLAILFAIAFCFKPMESHQYSGRDLLSDSAISLDGLFDVREKGLYADNSIADSIDIYVPVSALWRGSYNVTVKYIANDGSKIPMPELNSEENNFWETYSTNEYRISKFVNGEPVSGEVYIGKTEEVADYMAQYGLETKEFGYFTVGY